VPTNFVTLFPDHEKQSLTEHEELLDALAGRNAKRARSIAERHVLDAGRSLVD
jgi:DNA-binding GntR family transcriptional regulator